MKASLEVRLTSDAGLHADSGSSVKKHKGPTLRGYAAVFNSMSLDLGGFRERIVAGAFADSIKRREVLALYGHDHLSLLGRTRSGSLSLREDMRGLSFELTLPHTQLGDDIATLVERGDLTQMSFGFSVPKGGDTWSREGARSIRTLHEVILYEVSIVSEPAYSSTTVSLRRVLDAALAAELAARRRRLEALGV